MEGAYIVDYKAANAGMEAAAVLVVVVMPALSVCMTTANKAVVDKSVMTV